MRKLIPFFLLISAAVLQASTTIYIGANDNGPLAGQGDGDYNDPILSMKGAYPVGIALPMPTPNGDGSPFWDGNSGDGAGLGVGFFLTCSGGYAANLSCPNWDPSTTVYFDTDVFSTTGALGGTVMVELSANAANNRIWLHDNTGTHLLIDGSDTAGDAYVFIPSGPVFRLTLDTGNGGEGHIAAFAQIPEPSTFAMLGLGGAGILFGGWRRRRRS